MVEFQWSYKIEYTCIGMRIERKKFILFQWSYKIEYTCMNELLINSNFHDVSVII